VAKQAETCNKINQSNRSNVLIPKRTHMTIIVTPPYISEDPSCPLVPRTAVFRS